MEAKRDDVRILLEKFKSKNVLILGDIMIDSYMWGKVNRISPEAPIPVVSVVRREYRLGGAANVALNIRSLGAEPILCSVVGVDEKATIFRDLLKNNNMCSDGIISHPNRKTTIKTRVISGSQHLLRVDDEVDNPIEDDISDILIDTVKRICGERKIDLIIFEDYDKGVLTSYNISKLVNFAKSQGIFTAVDPKKRSFMCYSGVDLFKPNHKEFCEGIKKEVPKNDALTINDAAQIFLKQTSIAILLLTLSEHGIFVSNSKKYYHIPAEIRDIADVSGAGDTVISVAGLLLSCGADMESIANISNIAGGLVCEKTGVVPICPDELLSQFAN